MEITAGGVVVCGVGGFLLLFWAFLSCWRSLGDDDSDSDTSVVPTPTKQHDDEERQLPDDANYSTAPTESEDDDRISLASSPSSPPLPQKKLFLDRREAWTRAQYLFPGLVTRQHRLYSDPRKTVEKVVFELLMKKYRELRMQDEDQFEELMKPENAVQLCIDLGLNEDVVRFRYEAVRNLQRAFGLTSKTSTLTSIRHLIYRISIKNNPFGGEQDIADEQIRDHYRGKEWLSYLGVRVNKSDTNAALKSVDGQLKEKIYENCYMHGTNGTALAGIMRNDGVFEPSHSYCTDLGMKHDFGSGVYCFQGDIKKPLSFAIDRCWPLVGDQNDKQKVTGHNPAVVLFPNPKQYGSNKKNRIYEVGEGKPFGDDVHLKEEVFDKEYDEFCASRKEWGKSDKHWKEFVKLARYYGVRPGEGHTHVYFGLLHDCSTTHRTDMCGEPKIDKDRWIQHCFPEPRALGKERLFIEFDVDWTEWATLPKDFSKLYDDGGQDRKERFEKAVKDGKDELWKALRDA